jgi:hypothetical protein
MNALVERGAPRDFLDIHRIVTSGVMGLKETWSLWETRNPRRSSEEAKKMVLYQLHQLSGIEQRRPLDSIREQIERSKAEEHRKFL